MRGGDRSVLSVRAFILKLIQKSWALPLGQTPGQMQRYTTEETWALEMEIGGSEVKGCRELKRVRGQPGFHETHSERERGVGTKHK